MALQKLLFSENELLIYIKNTVETYISRYNLPNNEDGLRSAKYSLEHFCQLYEYHYKKLPVVYLDEINISGFDLAESELINIVKFEVKKDARTTT